MSKAVNLFHRAKYLTSGTTLQQLPADSGAEVAFVGRSNVGKSSAINLLCGQQRLAFPSKTPGRTQMINFFQLDEQRRLVDLPGYGFAKVPPKVQQQWQALLEGYLQQRQSLRGVVLLMDSRHPLKPSDQQFVTWAQHIGLPLHVLLTKADKLSHGAAMQMMYQVQRDLQLQGDELSLQLFSTLKKQGTEALASVLCEWLAYDEGE